MLHLKNVVLRFISRPWLSFFLGAWITLLIVFYKWPEKDITKLEKQNEMLKLQLKMSHNHIENIVKNNRENMETIRDFSNTVIINFLWVKICFSHHLHFLGYRWKYRSLWSYRCRISLWRIQFDERNRSSYQIDFVLSTKSYTLPSHGRRCSIYHSRNIIQHMGPSRRYSVHFILKSLIDSIII